jgi:hypothetical protein
MIEPTAAIADIFSSSFGLTPPAPAAVPRTPTREKKRNGPSVTAISGGLLAPTGGLLESLLMPPAAATTGDDGAGTDRSAHMALSMPAPSSPQMPEPVILSPKPALDLTQALIGVQAEATTVATTSRPLTLTGPAAMATDGSTASVVPDLLKPPPGTREAYGPFGYCIVSQWGLSERTGPGPDAPYRDPERIFAFHDMVKAVRRWQTETTVSIELDNGGWLCSVGTESLQHTEQLEGVFVFRVHNPGWHVSERLVPDPEARYKIKPEKTHADGALVSGDRRVRTMSGDWAVRLHTGNWLLESREGVQLLVRGHRGDWCIQSHASKFIVHALVVCDCCGGHANRSL